MPKRKAETGGIAPDRLRGLIERIERLAEEKAALADDIKAVFAEAKAAGFDTKTMRRIIKLRKLSAEDRAEQDHLLDLYRRALGLFEDTPLGQAAAGQGGEAA